ncbi:MAG TPA: glutamyl-tRNA reductase [Usitatibacter sp.]|jgi:glutamyl-tRNA reductase|nr:glutamyl-tRNA reductase [Usitatibacter sp.]
MSLHAFGINHHSAPLEVREKLAFPPERQADALAELAAQPGVAEAVLVSTCNRTEVYCRAQDAGAVRSWLIRQGERAGVAIADALYCHTGEAAVHHAFRVACGLDSMVLGEPQILGQVKQAVRTAETAGTLGPLLGQVFQQTFSVAKAVRTDTGLGAQSISMSAAALRLAQNVFGDLSRTRLLLVGVGEIVELAATYFAAQQPRAIVVANRTLARAEAFAERLMGTAIGLDVLPSRLHEFDIVVTGTAAAEPIITRPMMEAALKARRRRPMFVVDLAVPRDVDPAVRELSDVFLYTIDDLGSIVQQGAESRQAAVAAAEAIVTRQVEAFRAWQGARAAAPAIVELRRRADQYRDAELARAKARLARGDDPAIVLEALAKGLANKFLHHPTQALSRAAEAERAELVRAIERLYPEVPATDTARDG